jgi:tetratricopeptide (TPR) repeat protein
MLITAVLFLGLLFLSYPSRAEEPESYMPCASPVESAINTTLERLRAACRDKDLDLFLELIDPDDSAFRNQIKSRYADFFSLENASLSIDAGELFCRNDTVRVAVRRQLSYDLDSIPQHDSEWLWLELVDNGQGFKIVGEDNARFIRCDKTDLQVHLEPDSARMSGQCTLSLTVLDNGPNTIILALNRGLEVSNLSVNGRPHSDFERRGRIIEFSPADPLKAEDKFTVALEFAGSLFNESAPYGYSQVNIGPEGSFASWVTDWYPRNHSGSTKSSGHVLISVPGDLDVVCNGRQTSVDRSADESRYEFAVDTPQDFTFAAAHYLHDSADVKGITVGVYFLEGGREKVDLYMNICARILDYLVVVYGSYPFGSYYLVEIPSSVTGNLGGSSEQGMNLYPTGALAGDQANLPLLSHELAHSWWGNLVASASGPIISEGLAQLSAVLCIEHFDGEKAMRQFLKYGRPDYRQSAAQYFRRFTGPEPVVTDLPLGEQQLARASELHELADVKGHFVFEMLRRKIGREAFQRSLRNILKKYADRRVNLNELKAEFEFESGQDLATFWQQWFYRTGAPKFSLDYDLQRTDSGTTVQGAVRQDDKPYAVKAELAIYGKDVNKAVSLNISGADTPFSFQIAGEVDSIVFDPDYKIFRYTPEFEHIYLLAYGTKLRVDKKYEKAVASLKEFLEYDRDNMEGHYQLARAYQGLDDDSAAIRHFEKVIELHGRGVPYSWTVAYAHLNLGKMHLARKDTTMALDELRMTLDFPKERHAYDAAQALLDSLSAEN